jgi:hypothetical protein
VKACDALPVFFCRHDMMVIDTAPLGGINGKLALNIEDQIRKLR